jgi:hypothetical protein
MKEDAITNHPGAYLAGMARQSSRGQPGAALGQLHRGSTGSTPPWMLPLALHDHPRDAPAKHQARRQPEPAEPEPEMAMDLLGEEATAKSSWRRG